MSDIPLPLPGSLGLIQFAGVDMHAYAAAVSAADNARLREKVAAAEQASRWESDMCQQALERIKVLEEALEGALKWGAALSPDEHAKCRAALKRED